MATRTGAEWAKDAQALREWGEDLRRLVRMGGHGELMGGLLERAAALCGLESRRGEAPGYHGLRELAAGRTKTFSLEDVSELLRDRDLLVAQMAELQREVQGFEGAREVYTSNLAAQAERLRVLERQEREAPTRAEVLEWRRRLAESLDSGDADPHELRLVIGRLLEWARFPSDPQVGGLAAAPLHGSRVGESAPFPGCGCPDCLMRTPVKAPRAEDRPTCTACRENVAVMDGLCFVCLEQGVRLKAGIRRHAGMGTPAAIIAAAESVPGVARARLNEEPSSGTFTLVVDLHGGVDAAEFDGKALEDAVNEARPAGVKPSIRLVPHAIGWNPDVEPPPAVVAPPPPQCAHRRCTRLSVTADAPCCAECGAWARSDSSGRCTGCSEANAGTLCAHCMHPAHARGACRVSVPSETALTMCMCQNGINDGAFVVSTS